MTREERRARDEDFEKRLQPRMLWMSSMLGTAIRTRTGYAEKPAVVKKRWKPTVEEDNRIGRALRRRQNKFLRGWRPYAKR